MAGRAFRTKDEADFFNTITSDNDALNTGKQ